MLLALFVGTTVMIVSLAVAIALFGAAGRFLTWLHDTGALGYARAPILFDISIAASWILGVLTISVWGWAAVYMALGLFQTLEPALYFSIASFTTVGYGDVVLEPGWRLLAGMTATHGLLTFGLFTAFLVEVFNLPLRARRL
ncbi:ion channel [Sulfitobacter sp. JB4-11]|uniref:ion channel n=1 Tax=Sulfitobacter rhodophyticola TaxID=3238304 RepID=UPI003512D6E6